jgi:hypothetical protein
VINLNDVFFACLALRIRLIQTAVRVTFSVKTSYFQAIWFYELKKTVAFIQFDFRNFWSSDLHETATIRHILGLGMVV